MERNSSIDYIKGCLIFTVIIGHILLGSLDANLIRYVIYIRSICLHFSL